MTLCRILHLSFPVAGVCCFEAKIKKICLLTKRLIVVFHLHNLCLLCVLSYLVHHIAHVTFMQYVLLCSQCLHFGWHGCCSQRESDIRPLRRDGGRNRSQTWVSALCLIMGEMISFLCGRGRNKIIFWYIKSKITSLLIY